MISIRVIWCRLSRLRWHWKSVNHHLWCAEYVTTGFDRIKSSSACETAFRDYKSYTAHAHPGKNEPIWFLFYFHLLANKKPEFDSLFVFCCFCLRPLQNAMKENPGRNVWRNNNNPPPPPPLYSPPYGLLNVFRLFFPDKSRGVSSLSPQLCVASSRSDGLCCSRPRGGNVTHRRTWCVIRAWYKHADAGGGSEQPGGIPIDSWWETGADHFP